VGETGGYGGLVVVFELFNWYFQRSKWRYARIHFISTRCIFDLMKLRSVCILALLLLLLAAPVLHAQDTSQFVVKENFKREIVVGDKRYRVYNNWVCFGAGPAYHSENPRTQFGIGIDFQFHIKKNYFNMGGVLSGDYFGVWNNYTAHIGYVPWRKETEHKNIAAMAGLSYTQGYTYLYAGHYESQRWDRVGLHAEFQYTMKVQYAVGIGPTFFVDWNQKRTIVGVRLDGYLSGAYRGYVKGRAPKTMM